ncbi:MAG: YbaK/EbsC family protein [Anaerolineales bacterium]|nr:YbaK/EbsC family protein [Anaerolineales bacterium]
MSKITPISNYLTEHNIPHRQFTHPGQVRSFEQAAAERGQEPEQIVRSLLFRAAEDEFVMVLVAGPEQISWKALRRYLGQNRVTMATKEEVLSVTGYEIGAVAPFALPTPLRVLVDESVFRPQEVSIGSGTRNTTIILQTAALKAALGEVELVRFLAA